MSDDVARDMVEEFTPKPPRTLETCRALVAAGFIPHARRWVRGRRMELISVPFVQDGVSIKRSGCGIGVMVRDPNDPTTMVEWSIPLEDVRTAVQQQKRRDLDSDAVARTGNNAAELVMTCRPGVM